MRSTRTMLAAALLLLLGAAGCGDSRDLGTDTVARAAGLEFEVEEAAQLVAPVPDLPQEPAVLRALAEFWTDYTLLALSVNEEGVLDEMDLSAITEQQLNQELVMLLRDDVIDVDTTITDEELETRYETERPGERVRASHILLLIPEDGTEARRDSLRTLAEELRDRARAGEDFATMAETYSEDSVSAERGGDLNFFARGTMVGPFEEAAFALEPGDISDVVETQFGFHVIKVTDRERPDLAEMSDELREELRMERVQRAESTFVAEVEEPADVQIAEGAVEAVREMAEDADGLLEPASDRTLVTFEGGEYTAAQLRRFLLGQDPNVLQQIARANDEQVTSLLRNLARGELLVQAAEQRGLSLPEGENERLEEELRGEYRSVAERLGLASIAPEEGESLEEAVEREVRGLMERLVQGEQDVVPLGPLSVPLREHYGMRISAENAERASGRVAELRAEAAQGDGSDPESVPVPTGGGDTGGAGGGETTDTGGEGGSGGDGG